MAEHVRVLIVDDSAFVRRAVERMLSDLPDVKVVGTATNGVDAVDLVKRLSPDVVIMDVNMPELDGLEALKQIMADAPTSVLMMSTLTREGARTTLRALDLGAVDFVDKTAAGTVMDIYGLGPMLREKVRAVAGAALPRPSEPPPADRPADAPVPAAALRTRAASSSSRSAPRPAAHARSSSSSPASPPIWTRGSSSPSTCRPASRRPSPNGSTGGRRSKSGRRGTEMSSRPAPRSSRPAVRR
jgi:two-component system, chemotaxis family, protein-glutamate methylesterase/glutaminase